ncbi:Uncharacterised protein [Chryseobacterium gleum]|uniref:Uncharacterized protein n=2 Tax=Chryseobacterium gleum TaxID=250 RepID=A0A448AX45_CHRGE|nr:DUF2441 domain-containing protein [Chryseobacterium gleum]EFK35002.1 hypothetical protein HMPREF0204_14071 [Chryseobacterium gleum ATCC 35910]QQY30810.1 DUF2441 domain-containing protein [Chryseobacterium gleum]VEE04832.1 Uncharacterised protein [Chryseobacterium gleum]
MPEFYTVSRDDISNIKQFKLSKKEDINIDLIEVVDIFSQSDALAVIDNLYPHGISRHGMQYLYGSIDHVYDQYHHSYVSNYHAIEIIFELIRLLKFPSNPSRFTSTYAWETFEDAIRFKLENCNGCGDIYKVSCENYFKADMNLLLLGSIPGAMIFAEKYWKGESTKNPLWECLLYGPVNILGKVN